MPTYRLVALGCKVNRADAAEIERGLLAAGMERAPLGAGAELAIVCGCAVTATAEKKSLRALERVARENPGARIAAAGCIAVRLAQMGGCEAEGRARDGCARSFRPGDADTLVVPGAPADVLQALLTGHPQAHAPGGGFPGRTRAFLKIQDGCDASCAYCIVPSLRGRPRSRPQQEVLEEAERLVGAGHAEIVLAGVRLGAYSDGECRDRGALARLVESLLRLRSRGLLRLRLSSIEPADFDERLAAIASSESGLCPHFHLPLQSADDDVLRAMGRPYGVRDYRALVERIRSHVPDAAITTDVIAGFPGETPEAHARTVEFVRELRFARLHVFPFSPRPGTPAAAMPAGPARGLARSRAAELLAAGELAAREYRAQFLGRELEVLAEPGGRECRLAGYTERYARVAFDGPRRLVGRLVRVRAVAHARHGFQGELSE